IYEEPPLVNTKRPGTPGSLSAAIARSLSKEPELRFPSMEDFATGVWPEQPVASPTKGRAASPSRSRLKTTADAPTEITGRPPPAPPPPPTAPMSGGEVRPAPRSPAPRVIGPVGPAA